MSSFHAVRNNHADIDMPPSTEIGWETPLKDPVDQLLPVSDDILCACRCIFRAPILDLCGPG